MGKIPGKEKQMSIRLRIRNIMDQKKDGAGARQDR